MKKFVAIAALTALAGAAFAQSAPVNQIDLGFGYYGTDVTGVYAKAQNKATYGQESKYSPSLNWSGKYTYTYKVDDANTLKFALADDGWIGLYSGKEDDQAGKSGQNAGKITPSAQWSGFGADVTFGFPIYYFSPADKAGLNTLKYAYKEVGYLPINFSSTDTGKFPLEDNSVITSTQLAATYKYSFDKSAWISGGFSTQLAITPAPVLVAFLPKVTGFYSGAQLDVQFDDYNSYGNPNAAGDLKKAYSDFYLEPRVSYDFGFANLVPGLKAYVASRISLFTTNPTYDADANAGDDQNFHDSFVQPGVTYSFNVKDVGTFGVEGGWRFAKIDNVGKIKNDVLVAPNSPNKKDVAPYSELRLIVTYSTKF